MHIVDIATSWSVLKHVEATNQIQNSGWPFFVVESTLERQLCFQQQEWTWNVHELGSHIGATGFNIWRMQEGTPNYDKLAFRLYKKANHNMKLSVDRLQGSVRVLHLYQHLCASYNSDASKGKPRRDGACAGDAGYHER